jgi:UDP-GlcNAc3NAcA epimerase
LDLFWVLFQKKLKFSILSSLKNSLKNESLDFKMKIVSVVGARPEFIQAMPVSRAVSVDHEEVLVHTGQHYDYQMSQTFFDELEIPSPDYNLGIGSGSQAQQTANIMICLEEVLLKEKPELVIMRGDTNSSLAATLTSSKLNIPFAHIEAGERSFNRSMPEEINRLVADRLANMHFCVSENAIHNLVAEGLTDSVYLVGDVMLDALLYAQPLARAKSTVLERLQIEPHRYSLVTIHRPGNTDKAERLKEIMSALNRVSEKIIVPVHPRTQKALFNLDIQLGEHMGLIEPVSYFDMITLEENARLIATDSGGVQREAYYLGVPCLTLRDETEWVATVDTGWNKLVGADSMRILDAWFNLIPPSAHPPIYGTGVAAQKIAEALSERFLQLDER